MVHLVRYLLIFLSKKYIAQCCCSDWNKLYKTWTGKTVFKSDETPGFNLWSVTLLLCGRHWCYVFSLQKTKDVAVSSMQLVCAKSWNICSKDGFHNRFLKVYINHQIEKWMCTNIQDCIMLMLKCFKSLKHRPYLHGCSLKLT